MGAFLEADDAETLVQISQEIREKHPLGAYVPVLNPFLRAGVAALHAGMASLRQRYAFLPFDEEQICVSCLNALVPQALFQISKTVVLEMHVARVQGCLQGETPAERFADFVRRLSQEETQAALWTEYPALAHLVVSTIDLRVAYLLETLDHLCADWQVLRAMFAPKHDPGLLVDVQWGAGDTHRRGRSVQILRFAAGFQLVYKPKPLAIDVHFQELLAWLNEQGAQPPLRVLKLLDRGNYGWSEFVANTSCTSRAEVARFYERQGEYLALFYALNMTDCHSENVIACGEHPLLVDLESLFHPYVEGDVPAQSADMALHFLNQSVLRVGLLPQWSWSSEDSPGVDISGLGGQEGQMMPRPLPGWGEEGTDEMHLILRHVEMPASQNRPRLNEQDVHAHEYTAHILSGFTGMYRLLLRVRERLLAEQLPRCAHDEIRILIRPTRFYGLLLAASFHPDLLRNALERDGFFDRLWQEVEHWPDLARFTAAERRDLLRGDIPLFTTFPDSRMVFASDGEALFPLFKLSGLDLVQRQLHRLDERDLCQQIWIIQTSLATPHMGSASQIEDTLPVNPTSQPVQREQLLHLAQALGTRLEDLACQKDESATWLAVKPFRTKTWGIFPAGLDLYDGASGIILFLSYLGAITGEARFTSLARRALTPLRTQLATMRGEGAAPGTSIGAFDGWGSLLYLCAHLSVLWHEPGLLDEAEELAEQLPALIAADEHLDVLSGSAGCILSLLSLYAVHPAVRLLERAVQCGERLLATAQALPAGVGWITSQQEPALGGFSHGSAGIALSLLKLAAVSGEERFRRTALAALEYERSLFLPAQQNWADLRVQSDPAPPNQRERCMVAWCHGAPGIGLARLASFQQMDDPRVRAEIECALHTTLEHGLTGNHSLCHGAAGNIELLLTAAHLLKRQEDRERLEKALAMLVGSIETYGWITGVPSGVETPGLMTGLAGIGYELLRLAEPERVPSVVVVAPPVGLPGKQVHP